ncbi:MAG TPA: DUF302 domain-containing protein [Gammaproteobacteria bacterium]|nr:DUF302 domain-containing protein [Gammaproteobacteria bacterium]
MKKTTCFSIFIFTAVLLGFSNASLADDNKNGIIKLKSPYSVSETIDRLENVLNKKGMTIFKRVDHSAGAQKVGLELRPTQLLIFGNPKVGTPLMQCSQTAALDLPQKALAYKDASGQVWLAYNDPAYMAKRHDIEGCEKAVAKVTNALAKFSAAAVK